MRAVFRLFGFLLFLASLATPAAADGMRPLSGGSSPFMGAPAMPHMQFRGFIGQNRFIPQHFPQGRSLVNPGPVPPLNGTIVPPFSVGSMATNFDRFHDPFFFRRHRFAFEHDRFHRFHRFHAFPAVFPVAPFVFLEEVPNQNEVFDPNGEDGADVESTAPDASVAPPAKPTWRSGKSVLTGTPEKPRVIVVSPAQEPGSVQIFAPSGGSSTQTSQIVEIPQ